MEPRDILRAIDHSLTTVIDHGLDEQGLPFPIDSTGIDDEELRAICTRMETVFEMLTDAYRYSKELARGNLKAQPSHGNTFADPLRALQSNLLHLTWQADQIADGNLNHNVQYLGEFSHSVNRMISSLRNKKILDQRLIAMADVLGEGIILVDSQGIIIFSNPEASRLLGYSSDELEGRKIQTFIHTQDTNGTIFSPRKHPLYDAIQSGRDYNNNDGVFTAKSGVTIPVMIASRPVLKNSHIEGAVIAFHDISEQKRYLHSLEAINELLEKQATTDALTGIFNRKKFDRTINAEIERAHRYPSPLSLMMFDIDNFKAINDTYGHTEGDKVLKEIATHIFDNTRETEIFARWGGEEFALLVPGIVLSEAVFLADRLRGMLERHDFHIPQRVTASFGVATFQRGDSASSLIERADKALYRAKEGGRNQVQYVESERNLTIAV